MREAVSEVVAASPFRCCRHSAYRQKNHPRLDSDLSRGSTVAGDADVPPARAPSLGRRSPASEQSPPATRV